MSLERTVIRLLLAAIWVMLLATNCGLQNTMGFGSSNKKPASSDGQRPTDSSEGLPGYLTDPQSIAVQEGETEDEVVVRGDSGAVQAERSPIKDLRIVIWALPEIEINSILAGETMLDLAQASTVTSVDTDGSFTSENFMRNDGTTLLLGVLDRAVVDRGGKVDLPFTYNVNKPTVASASEDSFSGVSAPQYDDTNLTGSETVANCIEESGAFTEGLPVVRLTPQSGLLGVTYEDDRERNEPTIVLVEHSSTLNLAITMNLRDPNGLYCVKIATVTAGRVSINHNSDAEIDTHQVNVALAGITNISEL